MARKSTRGNEAQFTYDFGIAIAQGTVNKLAKLTGATLTLASAFYALRNTSSEYVDTLKENTLRFGGIINTLKAIEDAQNRIYSGKSFFNVDDQLKGMNRLMAVGVNVKENFDWINKAAHAIGVDFQQFSGMVSSAIQGNMQALVDAGFLTQRATRMFDKYGANTIMRQQAILNFLKAHRGLNDAIKNDFITIQDSIVRIKTTWKAFLKSVVGKPNDPESFYGQASSAMKMVADAFVRNADKMRAYGFMIGQVLGWVIKQVGHFVVWVGGKVKKAIDSIWRVTDDYKEKTRSFILWLEFWKLKIIDFFKAYKDEIKAVLKILLLYKALKTVFFISKAAIASVIAYKNALAGVLLLQKKYLLMMGPAVGNKFSRWLQSLAVFMPRWLRRMWVSVGKFFERGIFGGGFSKTLNKIVASLFGLKPLFSFLGKSAKFLFNIFRNFPKLILAIAKAGKALLVSLFASNPIGWVILAITLFTTLYSKVESFRALVNKTFQIIWEFLKLNWNLAMYILTAIMVGAKKVWGAFKKYIWNPIKDGFSYVWDGITKLWNRFMNSRVGKWISENIIDPLKGAFEWIVDVWNSLMGGLHKALQWLGLANTTVADATESMADKYGVVKLPTFPGGDYKEKDTENYLSNLNPFKSGTDKEVAKNPLISDNISPISTPVRTSPETQMVFNNGAIQIVVQGANMDEDKLARKVKDVLMDIGRENNMRGGMI